jgi:pSer/pThr/pTyr-binding forkhead associated (FHA) protein
MIICPNCHNKEIEGALFCSECGAQLEIEEFSNTHSFVNGELETDILTSQLTDDVQAPSVPSVTGEATLSLFLLDNKKVIPLVGRTEYTLGRIAEGQPILPDIDLSGFDAYGHGVSRLHAAIKIYNQKVVVVDLGSSNGTRVNGQKIVPNIDYPLNNGDIMALGKLRIQVVMHS